MQNFKEETRREKHFLFFFCNIRLYRSCFCFYLAVCAAIQHLLLYDNCARAVGWFIDSECRIIELCGNSIDKITLSKQQQQHNYII